MSQENVEIVRQNYEQLSKTGTPSSTRSTRKLSSISRGWRGVALMPGSGPSRDGRTPLTPGRSNPVSDQGRPRSGCRHRA